MRRGVFILLFFVVIVVGVFIVRTIVEWPQIVGNAIRVGDATFVVDVAQTPQEQARGLSGREGLAPGHGMLFPFASKSRVGFWMKDMRFSIDILWITDGSVVGIDAHLLPDDAADRAIYYPPKPIDAVLEIGAGEAERLGITIGDGVEF